MSLPEIPCRSDQTPPPIGPDKGWENYLYERRCSKRKKPPLPLDTPLPLDKYKAPTPRDVLRGERSTSRLLFWSLLTISTLIPLYAVCTNQLDQSSICIRTHQDQQSRSLTDSGYVVQQDFN